MEKYKVGDIVDFKEGKVNLILRIEKLHRNMLTYEVKVIYVISDPEDIYQDYWYYQIDYLNKNSKLCKGNWKLLYGK